MVPEQGPGWLQNRARKGPRGVPDGSKQGQNRPEQGLNRAGTLLQDPKGPAQPCPGLCSWAPLSPGGRSDTVDGQVGDV